MAWVIQSELYVETIVDRCEALDRATSHPQKRSYTMAELESLNTVQRYLGIKSYRETRAL